MPTAQGGYFNAAGEKLPSVTTVLNRFKDGGGLQRWNYTQGRKHGIHEFRYEMQRRMLRLRLRSPFSAKEHEYQTLVDICKVALGTDWEEQMPAPPKNVWDEVREAAEAGTIAHHLIERHVLTGKGLEAGNEDLPPICVAAKPAIKKRAINAFNQYLKWREGTRIKIIATEMPLVSEKYGFAGTPDAIGEEDDSRIVLLDWKTSNRVYADNMIQLAAYSLLLEENKPEWSPQGYHLLRVAKENAAFAHFHHEEMEVEKRQFLRFVEAYRDDQLITRRL